MICIHLLRIRIQLFFFFSVRICFQIRITVLISLHFSVVILTFSPLGSWSMPRMKVHSPAYFFLPVSYIKYNFLHTSFRLGAACCRPVLPLALHTGGRARSSSRPQLWPAAPAQPRARRFCGAPALACCSPLAAVATALPAAARQLVPVPAHAGTQRGQQVRGRGLRVDQKYLHSDWLWFLLHPAQPSDDSCSSHFTVSPFSCEL